jgi:hypothetical protein
MHHLPVRRILSIFVVLLTAQAAWSMKPGEHVVAETGGGADPMQIGRAVRG